MATALVTGGTAGIGASFARQLAARGFDLVLVARDAGRLESFASELHAASGINVETIAADLGNRGDVARVAARIEEAAHPIDLLVNNAGAPVHVALTSPDVQAHEHAFDVMCRAVLVLGGAAGRAMSGRGGAIINVSSLQSWLTTGSYGAMKSWVTTYSQSLAVELRHSNVRVTALLPGWVRTDWHNQGARRSTIPSWLWTDPDDVVRIALRDSDRGRAISIPTVRYRVLGWIVRYLPLRTVRWVSGAISSSKTSATAGAAGSESRSVKEASVKADEA